MQLSPPRVLAARTAAGLSQREVAERASVSIDTVRRAENGQHEPGANAIGRIAAALGVLIDDLYVHEPEGATTSNGHGEHDDESPAQTNAPAAVVSGATNAGRREGALTKE